MASVDWMGLLGFLLIAAAACLNWFYLLRGAFEAGRVFFERLASPLNEDYYLQVAPAEKLVFKQAMPSLLPAPL